MVKFLDRIKANQKHQETFQENVRTIFEELSNILTENNLKHTMDLSGLVNVKKGVKQNNLRKEIIVFELGAIYYNAYTGQILAFTYPNSLDQEKVDKYLSYTKQTLNGKGESFVLLDYTVPSKCHSREVIKNNLKVFTDRLYFVLECHNEK